MFIVSCCFSGHDKRNGQNAPAITATSTAAVLLLVLLLIGLLLLMLLCLAVAAVAAVPDDELLQHEDCLLHGNFGKWHEGLG